MEPALEVAVMVSDVLLVTGVNVIIMLLPICAVTQTFGDRQGMQ